MAEVRTLDPLSLKAADHRAALFQSQHKPVSLVRQHKGAKFSLFKKDVLIVDLRCILRETVHRSIIPIEVPLGLYMASGVHALQEVEVDLGVCSEVYRRGA